MQNKQLFKMGNLVRWLAMYILLLFSSGFYFRDNMGTRALIMMFIGSLLLMASYGLKSSQCTKKNLFIFATVLIFVIISSVIAQDEIKRTIIFLIGYISALIIVLSVRTVNYMSIYIKVLRSLILFSLVINFLEIIQIHAYNFLPSITLNDSHFMFLTNIRNYGSQIRNSSIFWEPGAFQTFLVISYIFELKIKNKNHALFRWLIIITLFTTLSTTGIICAFILLMCQIMENEDGLKNSSTLKRLLLILIIALVIVLVGLHYFSDRLDYLISRNITIKLRLLFSDSTQDASSTVRRDSIFYPLKMFLSNPLLGVGTAGLNTISDIAGHTMLTCTWLNWFAKSGVVYGLFMVVGLWRFITSGFKTKIIRILTFIAIVLSISSENYIDNPTIIVLSLYGFVIQNEIADKERQENEKSNFHIRNARSI